MNRIKLVAILAVLGIVTFVAMSSIYTVSEVEQAIITQFGKPVGAPVTTAGLKVKVPFIQDVNLMDKRVLEWDGNPTDMPTKDKLYISVDLFARWRIADPLQYFLRLHDERSAQSRLDDILFRNGPGGVKSPVSTSPSIGAPRLSITSVVVAGLLLPSVVGTQAATSCHQKKR